MTKRALITGITGQDGSYLAELLLQEGYHVIGMVRRASTMNFDRITPIQDDVELVSGDLHDEASLIHVLRENRPDEVYNLAAQSFVQTSFTQPVLTGEATALGVTRLLDAIRIVDPDIRFYQASSSEMFGKVVEVPQKESTPLYPRSPYGVAKVYGHWITINYRESYDLHASSGILFNHECIPMHEPVCVRRDGYIDIVPIGELIPTDQAANDDFSRFQGDGGGLEVWDGDGWVTVTARSAKWHDGESVIVHGRGGITESTPDHIVFTPDGEKPAEHFTAGDEVRLADQPYSAFTTVLTPDEAWLLGILAAGVRIGETGDGQVTSVDDAVLADVAERWSRVTGGSFRKQEGAPSASGARRLAAVELTGARPYLRMVRHELTTSAGLPRVPKRILNAAPELQREFLAGYCLGGGSKAGDGTDAAGAVRTTSPVLAAGLVWIARTALGRRTSIHRRRGDLGGSDTPVSDTPVRDTYEIDFATGAPIGADGAEDPDPQAAVREVERRRFRGWMCDLETTSGRFAAGVGFVVVHNSPRRGIEFVTRKITYGVARIKHGLDDKLPLGNLDAQRDWGFAGDYVRAMYLMLQQDRPDDYVVATGETHEVREFCELAFARAGLDYTDHVIQDERFMRPAEVDLLVGDPAKARATLGWEPTVSFPELVNMMVDADLELVERQKTHGII